MSKIPGIVYWVSIGDRETVISPDFTFGWIRNVGGMGRRGRPLCRLTRASYNTPEVNKSSSRANKLVLYH
jgi:hypothetical protein